MNAWKSETYLQHAAYAPGLGAAVLELLAPRPGERILDVGCGEGTLTQQIVARGATVVGFVAEFGGESNIAAIETAINVVLARRQLQPQARRYYPSDREYRARLTAHGLAVQQISLIPRPTPLPTGIRGWLGICERSTLDRLGADSESAVDEIEELLRPSPSDKGRWTADYVRLRVSATKAIP